MGAVVSRDKLNPRAMKTIIYATDFSENSIMALKVAYGFAKKFKSKLIVLHVFDMPVTLASTVAVSYLKKEKKLYVENRNKLKNFFDQHVDEVEMYLDVNFIVVEENSVANAILENAIKYNADLICVGAKGASALKEFFLGSTGKALLKKSPCTLIVVPATTKKTLFNKMVYATDFEQADIFALNRLVKIARKFDAQISVVHFTTKNEYAGEDQMEWFKEMLQEKVNYANMKFDLIFSDTIFEDLLDYVNDSEANLLAMLERKDNTFYQKYLQSDTVTKMVKDISVPLLSFNVGSL